MTRRKAQRRRQPRGRSASVRSRPVTRTVDVAHGRRNGGGGGPPRFYSIKAVAEALDVSTRSVRRWIANGDLVVHRVNGVVRISDLDLRAFLALHRGG